MVNWNSKKLHDVLVLANGIALIVLLNALASFWFFRIDLTEEKRFSIKPQTKALLNELEEPVYIEVFLGGELNPSFTRFQKSIRETLEEFRIYSNNKVRFTFTDPNAAIGEKARNEFMQDLMARGIQPRNVIDTRDGKREEKIIFPGALVSYEGFEKGVQLLKGAGSEQAINQSIENVEYELSNAIHILSNMERKTVGMFHGHGELDSLQIASLGRALAEKYAVKRVDDLSTAESLKRINMLIVAKPTQRFSEQHKFLLDQYIMQGGKVLFLIDKLEATMDSASRQDYYAFPYNLNLDDMLFRYGVRLNMDLVQDRSSAMTPVVTGNAGNRPEMQLLEWPFFPLINHYANHPMSRNLDAVITKFVSSMDTVKAEGVKKTPFMFTSIYARTLTTPVRVSINDIRKEITPENFSKPSIPVGYMLEGKFTSLYKNRFPPEGMEDATVLGESKNTKLIVVADGDLARNEVNPRSGKPLQLGLDRGTNYTFANEELLLNTVAWLLDEENGLLATRTKEVKIRPLDKEKVRNERLKWQVVNMATPVLVIVLFGMVWAFWRKKKFAGF